MSLRIDVGALRMNDETADSDGVTWGVTGWDGWDSAAISPATTRLTGRHGLAMLESRYQGRTVVLRGDAVCPSESAYWGAQNRLASLVALMTTSTLTFYETITKSLDVVAAAPVKVRTTPSLRFFEWDLALLALNPFKRGATHTVTLAANASTTITYIGTAQGLPTVTLTGSGTVDLVNSTTGTRVQTSSLANGSVIDMYQRTVYSGTTNTFSTVQPGVAWVTLQPGANTVRNDGTAPLSIQYFDLYL